MRILVAFVEARTWEQADLARHVDLTVRALRDNLKAMAQHLPIERQADPPRVYWSAPAGWLPGAASLTSAQVAACARLLARLPRTADRDELLRRLLDPRRPPPPTNPVDASHAEGGLRAVEDGCAGGHAVNLLYRSAHRGGHGEPRRVSVQRIVYGPFARFVAVCHRDDILKWFRVDRVVVASPAPGEPFRARSAEEVRAFVDGSVDGFRRGDAPLACRFFVRDPEARWVVGNLPSAPAKVRAVEGGTVVSLETAGLVPLARFLVGLGDAVRVETPVLRRMVHSLASAAGRASAEPGGEAKIRRVVEDGHSPVRSSADR